VMSPKTADLLTKYQREPMKEVNFRRMTGERGWLVNKHREPWTVPNWIELSSNPSIHIIELLTRRQPIHPYNRVAGENHQPQYKKIRIAADRNLRV